MKYTAVLSLLFAGAALADLPYHMPDPAGKRQLSEGVRPPIWSGRPTGTGGLPPPPPQGTGGAYPPHHGTGGPHSHSSSPPSSSSALPRNPWNQRHHHGGGSSSWAVPTGTGYFPGGPGPTGGFPGHGHSTLRTHTVSSYPTGTGSASAGSPVISAF